MVEAEELPAYEDKRRCEGVHPVTGLRCKFQKEHEQQLCMAVGDDPLRKDAKVVFRWRRGSTSAKSTHPLQAPILQEGGSPERDGITRPST